MSLWRFFLAVVCWASCHAPLTMARGHGGPGVVRPSTTRFLVQPQPAMVYYLSAAQDLFRWEHKHVVSPYFDERGEIALIQKYLSQILDWNWRMTSFETDYFCRPRAAEIDKMSANVSATEFLYETNPNHMKLIQDISAAINREASAVDALTLAACMRDVVNTKGWLRGLFTTLAAGRRDLRGYYTRPLLEIYPSELVNMEAVRAYKTQAGLPAGERVCVAVNGQVGLDNGVENRLWYWREDVMVNSFHWYWHLVHPFMLADDGQGEAATEVMAMANRRGELFYYVHHALVARYRTERMSVGLPELTSIELTRGAVVDEGYNSHLTDTNSGRNWRPRSPGRLVRDVQTRAVTGTNRVASVEPRLRQLAEIERAIQEGVAVAANGTRVSLTHARGIDTLGDMVEAAMWTLNEPLYGFPGPHNDGHLMLGLIEDPEGERNQTPGVMADVATAMRDPIFYRHHLATDAIFNRHKRTLRPYTVFGGEHQLLVPGVYVRDVQVQDTSIGSPVLVPNQLETFFTDTVYDVSRGLDFNGTFVDGGISTCVTHLDHRPFNFQLLLESKSRQKVTVRLYMAPAVNQYGEDLNMEDQRQLFFALDRFSVNLSVGVNQITQPSSSSSLTIPFPQSYTQVQSDTENETPFCGCGWPQHLLLPRGSPTGQIFDLVVMVTDGSDLADSDDVDDAGPGIGCRQATLFCGLVGADYPDSKPMGYPFDRIAYDLKMGRYLYDLQEFVGRVPNMGTTKIQIFHRAAQNDDENTNFPNQQQVVSTSLVDMQNVVADDDGQNLHRTGGQDALARFFDSIFVRYSRFST